MGGVAVKGVVGVLGVVANDDEKVFGVEGVGPNEREDDPKLDGPDGLKEKAGAADGGAGLCLPGFA